MRVAIRTFLAGLIVVASLHGQVKQPVQSDASSAENTLATLKGHKRALVVCGLNSLEDRFRTQLANLDGKDMADRDLFLIPVLQNWTDDDRDLRSAHAPFTIEPEQQALRTRFHIHPPDFTVILIGKDGGEKFRSHKPVTMEQLNRLIDAMPMRQQEMKSRNPH